MGLILCIETATTMCSAALGGNGKLLAVKELNAGYTHAENLTLFIEEVMKQADVKYTQLDAVAVSKGPGSYTGLRIGVSAAKGLCYALEKPLVSVDTLKHLSLSVSGGRAIPASTAGEIKNFEKDEVLFCPMLDARRMEVYCAVYDAVGKEIKPVRAEVIGADSFSDLMKNHKLVFFGDGAEKCKAVLGKNSNAVFLENIYPSAASMVPLAEEKFSQRQFENVAYFEPFYLKDFIGTKKM